MTSEHIFILTFVLQSQNRHGGSHTELRLGGNSSAERRDEMGASAVVSPSRWKEWASRQSPYVGQHVTIHNAVDCVPRLRNVTQKGVCKCTCKFNLNTSVPINVSIIQSLELHFVATRVILFRSDSHQSKFCPCCTLMNTLVSVL